MQLLRRGEYTLYMTPRGNMDLPGHSHPVGDRRHAFQPQLEGGIEIKSASIDLSEETIGEVGHSLIRPSQHLVRKGEAGNPAMLSSLRRH